MGAGSSEGEINMNQNEAMYTEEISSMAVGEGRICQQEAMEGTLNSFQEANPFAEIKLNELTAGILGKTVDTAVAVTQLAVSIPIGIAQITLESAGKWFSSGTEGVNKQVNATVNRIFGVKGK